MSSERAPGYLSVLKKVADSPSVERIRNKTVMPLEGNVPIFASVFSGLDTSIKNLTEEISNASYGMTVLQPLWRGHKSELDRYMDIKESEIRILAEGLKDALNVISEFENEKVESVQEDRADRPIIELIWGFYRKLQQEEFTEEERIAKVKTKFKTHETELNEFLKELAA